MKYDFLIKEKFKNSSDEPYENINKNADKSIIGSTMLSTYEDFNIFLKKTQDKIIDIKEENNDTNKNKETENIKNEITDNKKNITKDNSTLFESEKKTVETIVKYSSSFFNFLLKFINIIKNSLIQLILRKKVNLSTTKDKEIINRFNNNNIKRKKKHRKTNDKHRETNDKHIKKMNSYLIELE
jgi:hypothetical protein